MQPFLPLNAFKGILLNTSLKKTYLLDLEKCSEKDSGKTYLLDLEKYSEKDSGKTYLLDLEKYSEKDSG